MTNQNNSGKKAAILEEKKELSQKWHCKYASHTNNYDDLNSDI